MYICDSRGVRDIYDTDGSNAIAASEPLAVLVYIFSPTSMSLQSFFDMVSPTDVYSNNPLGKQGNSKC